MRFRDILLATVIILIGINITAAKRDDYPRWQKFVANTESLFRHFEYSTGFDSGYYSWRFQDRNLRDFKVMSDWCRVDSIERTLPSTEIKQIIVECTSGDIAVIGHNAFAVNIQAVRWGKASDFDQAYNQGRQIELDITRRGDTLIIKDIYPKGLEQFASMDITIHAPPRAAVIDAKTTAGHIFIEDFYNGVTAASTSGSITVYGGDFAKVSSTSGDLEIAGIRGPAHIESTSGRLNLYDNSGEITARTTSGDIEIDDLAGSLDIASISGNILLKSHDNSQKIAFATTSGDITANLYDDREHYRPVGRSLEQFSATTISGNIGLTLPADPNASLELRSSAGRINCDLPLENKTAKRGYLSGALGDASIATAVSINSTSGDISVTALPAPADVDEEND